MSDVELYFRASTRIGLYRPARVVTKTALLINAREGARRLGMIPEALYEELGKGSGARIPHLRIGRRIRLDATALDEYIRVQTVGRKVEARTDHLAVRRSPTSPETAP